MFKEIEIEEALSMPNKCFIDVRSPAEFSAATIPGAINLPLFNDEERHNIGIIYHAEGAAKAKMEGLIIVASKLPHIVQTFFSCTAGKKPIIFCWRGGLRSQAVATVLDLLGVEVFRLHGGYRAYRQFIVRKLSTFQLTTTELVVIDGFTGVGKTIILHKLKNRGHPVLDLETMAGHRGSVFGQLGLNNVRGQKMFDALLWECLQSVANKPYILVEGESKRIGNVFLPDFLFKAMHNGRHILVEVDLAIRVQRILQEYAGNHETLIYDAAKALEKITKHLGKRLEIELKEWLMKGDLHSFVEIILTKYYDPLYEKSQPAQKNYVAIVNANDMETAVNHIESYLQKTFSA